MSSNCQRQASCRQSGMSSRENTCSINATRHNCKKIIAEVGVTNGAVTQTVAQYTDSSFKGFRIRQYIAQALG